MLQEMRKLRRHLASLLDPFPELQAIVKARNGGCLALNKKKMMNNFTVSGAQSPICLFLYLQKDETARKKMLKILQR